MPRLDSYENSIATSVGAAEPGQGARSLTSATRENGPGSKGEIRAGGRIPALDFTKGALVLIMVLYHWLNYFIGPQGSYYRYLSFLPPSFICITGFLVAHVYLSNQRVADPYLPRRLAVRGLKIFGIFVVLNLLIGMLIPSSSNGGSFREVLSPAKLWSIYGSGNMRGGRVVAFYVLVPISYLLILSAGVIVIREFYKYAFQIATLLAFSGILLLYLRDQQSQNLNLLFIGLLGTSIGHIPIQRISELRRRLSLAVLAYLAYVIAITIWNILYPLQVGGVLLTLLLLYMAGTASGDRGRIPSALIVLGKYSLFAYIVQIAILQMLRRSLGVELSVWALVLSFMIAMGLTYFSVEAVDYARGRIPLFNRFYTAVFA